ncbi:4-hydroxy-3-methylbut-2-enyl diphosphate reductase [bacterium]|nr:4-hydroxy-3-methylbut-2-enyl diphosphate reductase [bacterium]
MIYTKRNIKLAKSAGFCYGVNRAVKSTMELKVSSDKDVYVLGELIHNAHVINELTDMGINTVSELPPNGCGYCVIRSHGVAPSIISDIENKGYKILDMTCPDVKKVQQKAIELVKNDYFLLILGKESHPEVEAIKANAQQFSNKIFVINNEDDLKNKIDLIKENNKIGIVVQTTQKIDFLKNIVSELLPLTKELKVFNTICPSTAKRQKEAVEIAKESDLMIVIGGKNSANTTHLAEILKDITPTIHIEDATELSKYNENIKNAQNIGVTAGASTPKDVIDEVMTKLSC